MDDRLKPGSIDAVHVGKEVVATLMGKNGYLEDGPIGGFFAQRNWWSGKNARFISNYNPDGFCPGTQEEKELTTYSLIILTLDLIRYMSYGLTDPRQRKHMIHTVCKGAINLDHNLELLEQRKNNGGGGAEEGSGEGDEVSNS